MELKIMIDSPIENQMSSGDLFITGWILSHKGTANLSFRLNNKKIDSHIFRTERPDVLSIFPEYKDSNPLPGFVVILRKTQTSIGKYKLTITGRENKKEISKSVSIEIVNKNNSKNFDWNLANNNFLNRNQKILSNIDVKMQDGLEIGPLSSPVVTRKESNGRIWYMDCLSTEELIKKYENDPSVSLEQIVAVDFIWGEKTIPELVENRFFDYVIASHVIEHIPDMIGWLIEIEKVLKDNGILSLVIPDKRFTFDYLRELSSPGMLLEAFLRHQRRPGPREVFDYYSSMISLDTTSAWSGNVKMSNLIPLHDPQTAFNLAQDCFQSDHYHDVHVNTFTPQSFLNLLETLMKINLLNYNVLDFFDTTPGTLEFFVTLERNPRNTDTKVYKTQQLESINKAKKHLFLFDV